MRMLELVTTHDFVRAAGLALLHSVWQSSAVAVLLAGALMLLGRGASANARHAAACGALCLMTLAPLVTFWRASGATTTATTPFTPNSGGGAGRAAGAGFAGGNTTSAGVNAPGRPGDRRRGVAEVDWLLPPASSPTPAAAWRAVDEVLPWLALAWLAGALAMSVRLFAGWRRLGLVMRAASPPSGPWEESFARLARRVGAPAKVRLLESSLVHVPSAVGWRRPAVLLPAGVLEEGGGALTAAQLEALVAHELAHVRRRDYLINLFQRSAEALLFYHPAAWWVSRRIRRERERACDDAAVAWCCGGDALLYARALTAAERLRRLSAAPGLAMSIAAGGGDTLTDRVRRLVEPRRARTNSFAESLAGILVIAGVLTLGTVAEASLLPRVIRLAGQASRAAHDAEAGAASTQIVTPSGPAISVTSATHGNTAGGTVGHGAQPRAAAAQQQQPTPTPLPQQQQPMPPTPPPPPPPPPPGDFVQSQSARRVAAPPVSDFNRRLFRPLADAELREFARQARQALGERQALGREQTERLTRRARQALDALPPPPPPSRSGGQEETPAPYARWLNEDAAYVITGQERRAFTRLRTDEEREAFIDAFWRRRDARPETDRNEFREEHYRRISFANEHFSTDAAPGWMTERGRAYIIHGQSAK